MTRILISLIPLCCLAIIVYACLLGRPLVLEKDTSLPFAMPEEYRNALYYASMAPSGHNAQPWNVLYDAQADSFTLLFDSGRGLAQVDPQNREAFISLGAFLENWQQAAQAYGYTARVSILPKPGFNMEAAQVVLRKTGSPPAGAGQRLTRMLTRHTDKRSFEAAPVPESAINAILAKNQPYLRFYAKGTPEFVWLSHNAVDAMRVQAGHKGKSLELAGWMRFSNAEARAAKDGLPAEQLGMGWLAKAAFYTFFSRDDAATDSFAREAVKQTEKQLSSAAGFFVVTGAADFRGTVEAGRCFEKFWLDAVDLGISIQPMSQVLEEELFAGSAMKALNLDTPIQMIVRAGIMKDYGHNNRIRRDINTFLLTNKQPLPRGPR